MILSPVEGEREGERAGEREGEREGEGRREEGGDTIPAAFSSVGYSVASSVVDINMLVIYFNHSLSSPSPS